MTQVDLSDALQEEMSARGWTDADIDERLPDPVDRLSVFFAIYYRSEDVRLDEYTARLLSRVFDVSAEFFVNLRKAGQDG